MRPALLPPPHINMWTPFPPYRFPSLVLNRPIRSRFIHIPNRPISPAFTVKMERRRKDFEFKALRLSQQSPCSSHSRKPRQDKEPKTLAKLPPPFLPLISFSTAMAKKKLADQHKPPAAVSDNLRALNSRLLAETSDLRKQVEALKTSKLSLEDQAAHFAVQESVIRAFLSEWLMAQISEAEKGKEEMAREFRLLEAERDRVKEEIAYLEERMGKIVAENADKGAEMTKLLEQKMWLSGEVEKVSKELGSCKPEIGWLRSKITELGNRNAEVEEELRHSRTDWEALMAEKVAVERMCSKTEEEKRNVERSLEESLRNCDVLRSDLDERLRERCTQDIEISKLREEVVWLGEEIASGKDAFDGVRREKEELHLVVESLRETIKKCEAEKEENEIVMAEKETKRCFLEEKLGQLNSVIAKLESQLDVEKTMYREQVSRVLSEKDAIQAGFNSLKQDVECLRAEMFTLEHNHRIAELEFLRLSEKCNGLLEEKEEREKSFQDLASSKEMLEKEHANSWEKVRELMRKMNEDVHEKNRIEKWLTEKSSEVAELQEKCRAQVESSDRFEEEIVSLKVACARVLDEKNGVQKELDNLKKDTDHDLQVMQGKLKEAEMVSERAFLLLKKAADAMGSSQNREKEHVDDAWPKDMEIEPDIKPFARELEAIRWAFKARDVKLEDLSQEIQSLQMSVDQAQKRNLWTLLSSATVIVAASVAYIVRGH